MSSCPEITGLPEPLTPPDCDLRGFPYMPLDVARLRDSDLAALPDAEARWANVISWAASWHQVPAGSLPNDDTALARLLGYGRDVDAWTKVREAGGLRGWTLCADGRLYHPVVAEKALAAWIARRQQRAKALKRWGVGDSAPAATGNDAVAHATALPLHMQERVKGEGEGIENTPRARVPRSRRESEPEGFAEWYAAYPRKAARTDAARAFARALKTGATAEGLTAALRRAAFRTDDPQFIPYPATWLNKGHWRDAPASVPAPATAAEPNHPWWPRLAAQISTTDFRQWIARLRVVEEPGDEVRLAAPSAFHAAHVQQNFGHALRAMFGKRVVITSTPNKD